MDVTDWISAGTAVASVLVAALVGGAAVVVARRANGISGDAVKVAQEAREIAGDALRESKRQAILSSVPHLVTDRPVAHGAQPTRFEVKVSNGGPTVAYGILVSIAGASERSLDAIDEATRAWSGRQVALQPGADRMSLSVKGARVEGFPWVHVRLEYVSPLGAHVRHDYLAPEDGRDRRYRLHLVTIDPKDGSEPILFPIELGPFDDEPDLRPPAVIA